MNRYYWLCVIYVPVAILLVGWLYVRVLTWLLQP